MTTKEILKVQTYDSDDTNMNKAETITNILLSEFNLIYSELKDNDTSQVDTRIANIRSAIDSADKIEMNYSMFDKDIVFINSYKR